MRKLNELTGTELCDVLCAIADPVARIMEDPAVDRCFQQLREAANGGASAAVSVTRSMMILAPAFLSERNREDTFRVLSVLKGVSVEDVLAQPGAQTAQDVMMMVLHDGGLLSIFRPAAAG